MIEFWNRHGKQISPRGQLDFLARCFLPDIMPPGTALDSFWSRETESLLIYDVTHYGVRKNRYKALAELAEPLDSHSPDHPWEPWQTVRLKLVSKVEFYWPPMPVVSTTNFLTLPPDDWRMEMKPKGDRLLILSQPDGVYQSMDMRAIDLDLRMNVLARLSRFFDVPSIALVPTEGAAFQSVYEEWKHFLHADGIMMRRRNSSYKASTKKTIRNKNWLMMRFKRSPRS